MTLNASPTLLTHTHSFKMGFISTSIDRYLENPGLLISTYIMAYFS